MGLPPNSHVDVVPRDDEALLQIHLAEYQALTNRCSYWITVQVALLPLFLIVIGIAAQMWQAAQNRALLLWCGMIIIQLLVMSYIHIAAEIYNAVCYVECELRPAMQKVLRASPKFWRYEAFLAKRRRKGPIWEEYILPCCDVGAIGLIISLFRPCYRMDYIALGMNLTLLAMILVNTWKLVRIRRQLTQCAVGA
jgi:hypothetical protein